MRSILDFFFVPRYTKQIHQLFKYSMSKCWDFVDQLPIMFNKYLEHFGWTLVKLVVYWEENIVSNGSSKRYIVSLIWQWWVDDNTCIWFYLLWFMKRTIDTICYLQLIYIKYPDVVIRDIYLNWWWWTWSYLYNKMWCPYPS